MGGRALAAAGVRDGRVEFGAAVAARGAGRRGAAGAAGEGDEVVWECAATGLTQRRHPLAVRRSKTATMVLKTTADSHDLPTA